MSLLLNKLTKPANNNINKTILGPGGLGAEGVQVSVM